MKNSLKCDIMDFKMADLWRSALSNKDPIKLELFILKQNNHDKYL